MATASERMAAHDAERLRRRQLRTDQRYTAQAAERQDFQSRKMARRDRMAQFKQETAGVQAGTGLNTLENRQRYVVGGQRPDASPVALTPLGEAGVRGQTLPQYEAVGRAAEQQRAAMDLARFEASVPLVLGQGEQKTERYVADQRLAGTVAGAQADLGVADIGARAERYTADQRLAGVQYQSAAEEAAAKASLVSGVQQKVLDRRHETMMQERELGAQADLAKARYAPQDPEQIQVLDRLRKQAVGQLGENAAEEDIQARMKELAQIIYQSGS